MNYKEEQESELEALESIYPTEFKLIQDDPYIFTVFIKSQSYEDGENGLCSTLKFNLPANYPEVEPEVEILVPSGEDEEGNTIEDDFETNLEPEHVEDLQKFLAKTAADNLGMPMVFTLVSEGQEWLNSRYDSELRAREEEEERRILEAEEAERNRFEGTKVNVQNFMEWKKGFDAEIALKRRDQIQKEKELIGNKLTGRELFLRDKTLNESDLQFVEEGEVPIDESLFDDMDDLEIEDDED